MKTSPIVLKVVRDVTSFQDTAGQPVDNYGTHYKFAEIVGLLPLSTITKADIDLAAIWLNSRFDHGLVATSLSKGLLKRFLVEGNTTDIERACLLMKQLMAYRWLPEEDRRGRELVTLVDDYWLKRIIDTYAKELGIRAGLLAVKIFEDGLRAIFSDSRRGYGSALWRRAIEDNSQNTDFRAAENRFVEGMRDALAGWIETKPDAAVEYVTRTLKDEVEIVRRMVIHMVTEYFELLREPFEDIIDADLFSSGYRHEMYRLLKERFAGLSQSGKAKVHSGSTCAAQAKERRRPGPSPQIHPA